MSGRVDGRTVRGVARRIGELIVQGHRADYELGAEIAMVMEQRMWAAWPDHGGPFDSLNDWSWHVLGFKERKARYLKDNYLALSAINPSPDTLARALRLGWTKLAHVLRVAGSEVELLRWIDRVEEEKLSEEDLRAEVALLRGKRDAAGDPDSDSSESGGSSGSESDPSDARRRIKYPLTFVSEADLKTFVRALKLIRKRVNPEMSYGEAAALMATSYLATSARDDEGGLAVELETIIEAIEQTYNVRLEVASDQPAPRQLAGAAGDDPALDGFAA